MLSLPTLDAWIFPIWAVLPVSLLVLEFKTITGAFILYRVPEGNEGKLNLNNEDDFVLSFDGR